MGRRRWPKGVRLRPTRGGRWLDRGTGTIEPTITGTAFVNSEATLLLDAQDPFCWGIR